ncbi:MAG: 2-oxo acid dehydrogenase subunit E2, partial [Steroidobacteraceae bacterium]
ITSFLVTAAVRALRRFPALNAARDGTDVLFRRYCDIAISVEVASGARSTLLRNAECMSFAAIEAEVWPPPAAESPEPPFEDDCGTFRLLQCGLAGAMLSTPQLYPGHAAALAAHEIRHRAVAVSSRVEIRRMMYIALTYDHCVVDGSESVQFLYAIKASLERPETLLTRELPEAPSPPAQLRPRIRVA